MSQIDDDGTVPEASDEGVVIFDDMPRADQANEPITVPLSDQASVDRESEKWAGEWASRAVYSEPSFLSLAAERLPALALLAARCAIATFPAGTGVGDDNIGPRALGRLGDDALLALLRIFAACEALGSWGTAAFHVLIVLLPKPDGGLRPIGLFPTIIRVWMRMRSSVARAWESANALPQLYGGAGMGAQRAAWVAAFQAEKAQADGLEHVAALLDLVKAFERVPHDRLVEFATRRGYSLIVLRLSLATYRLRRAIGIGGAFSSLIVATRGITAGSGMATTELRVLLIDVVESVSRWWPLAQLTLSVDDFDHCDDLGFSCRE